MKKLAALGYDGPVTPEPFSKRINALEDPREAAELRRQNIWRVCGRLAAWLKQSSAKADAAGLPDYERCGRRDLQVDFGRIFEAFDETLGG